jgi:ribosomal protein L11 methyltransferase
LSGRFSLQAAQLVFANILAPVLIQLLDQRLGDLVLPGGRIILSGILAEQSENVELALNQHGFQHIERRQMGDWVALAAGR